MKSGFIFFRLIITDIKRLKNYIFSILISAIVLMSVCGVAGSFLAKNMYRESSQESIAIAYYIPQDEDTKATTFAIDMLENIESMKSIATLIQVNTIQEGYNLLDSGDALYYIIVPENFFSGIMNGTNTPLEILVWNNTSITAYVANELFISYAKYLGLAQAAVYSVIDTAIAEGLPGDTVSSLQGTINMTFLDRSLNKDHFVKTTNATGEGSYTLAQHYMASALMLSLFFMSFVFIPHLQGTGNGTKIKLSAYRLNSFHIFVSNFISSVIALYIGFVPCFVGISIISGTFNPLGLITIIVPISIIGLIISAVCFFCKNNFAANMTILILALLIAYMGGGIMPEALLPAVVKDCFGFMPGKEIISGIAYALYGI